MLLFVVILNCGTASKSQGIFDRWGSRVGASADRYGGAIEVEDIDIF